MYVIICKEYIMYRVKKTGPSINHLFRFPQQQQLLRENKNKPKPKTTYLKKKSDLDISILLLGLSNARIVFNSMIFQSVCP